MIQYIVLGSLFVYVCILAIIEWREDAAKEWEFKE